MANNRRRTTKRAKATQLPNKLGGGSAKPIPTGELPPNTPSKHGNKYNMCIQQWRFFNEYIKDYDKVRAYTTAGYKGKNPAAAATRLLILPQMKFALDDWEQRKNKEAEIDQDRILLELGRLALCDVRKFFMPDGSFMDIHKLGDAEAAAISDLKLGVSEDGKVYIKSLKLCNKESALIKYGQHIGMFKPDSMKITDPEMLAKKTSEALAAMTKTLPIEFDNVIQGHFNKKKRV